MKRIKLSKDCFLEGKILKKGTEIEILEYNRTSKTKYGDTAKNKDRYGSNKTMDKDTYNLRRRVMKHIYEAKNAIEKSGRDFDRVTVRITQDTIHSVLGFSRRGDYIIWVPEETVNEPEELLRYVVYHELLHGNYDIGHNDLNFLMRPVLPKRMKSLEELNTALIEQLTHFNK